VERPLKELLVALAGVEAVVEPAVGPEAADEAGGDRGRRGGCGAVLQVLGVQRGVGRAKPTLGFSAHSQGRCCNALVSQLSVYF